MLTLPTEKSPYTLALGDCLDLLKELPDACADAVITDPPYFQGVTHNGQKAVFSDLAICRPFWREFYREIARVLHPERGCFYQFTDWKAYAFYYPLASETLPIKNALIWDKMNGAGNFYTFSYEMILFATNNNRWISHGPNKMNVLRGYPCFAGGAKKTNGEKVHPTQKTVELITSLILDSTDPGALVIDPFMGSGTTGVACLKSDRRFIGFELVENYYQIAEERIKAC